MTSHQPPANRPLTIALCAGEASGDLLGAHLMAAIKQRCPQAHFVGIGGPRMLAKGFESLYDQEKLAVRGFAEVVKRLPEILKIRRGLVRDLKRIRPDVFVGIDAPDFNLGVAEKLKKAGIPTVHYVSPSVWAWRRERVNTIVEQVNRVLCLFPMEPQLYQEAGGRAEFVGHPLAQTLPLDADRDAARRHMKIEPWEPVFCLMPGSRVSEIDYMAPIFFRTARLLLQRYPSARFLLPVATVATRSRLISILHQGEFIGLPIQLMSAHADLACTAADVVLVTSGTATLEVALCKRPMVISYKISPLTYAYVKRKINVPHVGLPNILLGKGAVPELLQDDATPAKLAAAVAEWYESPQDVAALQQDFLNLHRLLQKDTDALAASAVLAEAGIAAAVPEAAPEAV
ncbi:lipid-A-disaccharide synthase [Neisseria dentiae]|uniref:Lipid-A-disaccharide synthase n=1 Tax=Neisseria dentiae TaxID=194197 RepID=A0A1X3DDL2_9NEIS|nr:lipid-A-disaccharide synthase [Neisseria dentiae]OSI17980.1 lipid-A-disaccharide synthase [Neisseria dentiae]QMT45115.1 lipid-A-disaccharide synthase [Neisseria dentiae]STZ50872.1 lipid-A-disaccharide synthase [Neisseria dentiae]